MIDLSEPIFKFFSKVAAKEIEIYNEFSLQHELGIFIRSSISPYYKVQFERHISFFRIADYDLVKKEIDIAVYSPDQLEKHAIELKFPRNGQYPEQMFMACKDICFLEQLHTNGFSKCYFVIVADDSGFYEKKTKNDEIYRFFRDNIPIHGEIQKPTGRKDTFISISRSYLISWNIISGKMKYSFIKI